MECSNRSEASSVGGPSKERKKERKQTTQGRDGRTARRHHTGILRRGVWCDSRRPPLGVRLFLSLFAVLLPILASTFVPPRGRPLLVVLYLVASSSVASLSSASSCDGAAACRSLAMPGEDNAGLSGPRLPALQPNAPAAESPSPAATAHGERRPATGALHRTPPQTCCCPPACARAAHCSPSPPAPARTPSTLWPERPARSRQKVLHGPSGKSCTVLPEIPARSIRKILLWPS